MASPELDEQGGEKLVNGKLSIVKRAFVIRGMDKNVQDRLREQYDALPISHLLILWMERFEKENKLGFFAINPETKAKIVSGTDYDAVEKSVISDYLNRPPE